MEMRASFSSQNYLTTLVSKPIFLSAKSSCFTRISLKSPPASENSRLFLNRARNSFLGDRLEVAFEMGDFRNSRALPPVSAVINRVKEKALDDVIQSQKKLKLVSKVKHLLLKNPNKTMSVRDLGRHRKFLGLLRSRRIISVLKKFPAVFDVFEGEPFCMYFRLTPEAEQLVVEEREIRKQMEGVLVENLRKLVMMSLNKRILLKKIVHLGTDMGLPQDFDTNLCKKYPQFFSVVATDFGPALELTSWDPVLAVSAAEKRAEEEAKQPRKDMIIDRPPKFKHITHLPKGFKVSRKHRDYIIKFQELPYISPYSDFRDLKPASMEAEKHACAVVHELLSLTLEKKTLVDHVTHFRNDFRFSNKLRGMLLRHPELFYVSLKGQRDSVFLREAYQGSELIEKSPLLAAKERLQALVSTRKRLKEDDESLSEEDEGDYDEDLESDDKLNDFMEESPVVTDEKQFFRAPALVEKQLATVDAGTTEHW
eukprot:Gb_34809 [translate_table: standard]